MPAFRLSRLARLDLIQIRDYTLQEWGAEQASLYARDLRAFCQTLALNPQIGRKCDEVHSGYRRMEHGSHVIFYRPTPGGILISRVLHQRQLPSKTLLH